MTTMSNLLVNLKVETIWEFERHAGERVPWWLGYAYTDPLLAETHLFPIPLNLLVRWVRASYLWARAGGGAVDVDRTARLHVRKAHARGYDEGWNACAEDVERWLNDATAAAYGEIFRPHITLFRR